MISLTNVSKSYKTRLGNHLVLNDISLSISRGQKIGILGRNGAGKSTLIRLISGAESPDHGKITREMSVSWPIAFGGAFQTSLTGIDNVKFICRIYGKEYPSIIGFVEDFSELGKYMNEPIKVYSAGMRARLAFAISMAIEFDCYLIDEVIAVGDSKFQEKCRSELFDKRADRALILVSHEYHNIKEYCDTLAVIYNGQLKQFNDIDAAYNFYNEVY